MSYKTADERRLAQANSRLRRGHVPTLPLSLPFRCIAGTCGTCGNLVTFTNIRRGTPRTPMKHPCRTEQMRRWRAANPDRRTGQMQRWRAANPQGPRPGRFDYNLKSQARTVDGASRRGYDWTSPELMVAARTDLSAVEVAVLLGRTVYGVKSIRRQLRVDPRKIRMAS